MEQKEKSIMFYDICRLCLEEHGHCAIYERDGLSVDIYRCIGVKVLPADNLPQRICKNCLYIVTKATELRVQAKKNECYLKGHCEDDENQKDINMLSLCKETTTNTEDLMETVTSKYFQKDNKCTQEKNYAIEKFLKARKNLLNSSIIEDSSMNRVKKPKSSKKQARKKSKKNDDSDTEYEICETYYIFSESITSETSQSDTSSQKPPSQKRLKFKDENMSEHECDVCSKTFNTHKKLYLHQRQHNKNFCCPIDECEKKFSTKGDVQKHVRTHTGEKPYACDMCDKKFAQRVTLRSHKESIHSAG